MRHDRWFDIISTWVAHLFRGGGLVSGFGFDSPTAKAMGHPNHQTTSDEALKPFVGFGFAEDFYRAVVFVFSV